MSPFEKNPFAWRQLWRVVERCLQTPNPKPQTLIHEPHAHKSDPQTLKPKPWTSGPESGFGPQDPDP
jgi:hypothetical protein